MNVPCPASLKSIDRDMMLNSITTSLTLIYANTQLSHAPHGGVRPNSLACQCPSPREAVVELNINVNMAQVQRHYPAMAIEYLTWKQNTSEVEPIRLGTGSGTRNAHVVASQVQTYKRFPLQLGGKWPEPMFVARFGQNGIRLPKE